MKTAEEPRDQLRDQVAALRASAGAWTDDAHPDLATRDDVLQYVRELRAGSAWKPRPPLPSGES